MHDPMDLSEWVNCDNTIPPFEPLPETEKRTERSKPLHEWFVWQCPTPDLSVIVDTGAVKYRLSVKEGHSLYTRMDRILWNHSTNEIEIYYGVPAPSYELPPIFNNQETIAAIIVWPNSNYISQNMIMNYNFNDRDGYDRNK